MQYAFLIGVAVGMTLITAYGFLIRLIDSQRKATDSYTYYKRYFNRQICEGYAEVVDEFARKMPPGVLRSAAVEVLDEYESKK